MSYKILSPAWEAHLPTPQKFLLVSLADQANDEGVCWPSIASLTKRTGLQERTVYKHLSELESLGHITRIPRDGRSTVYRVHPCTTCTPVKDDTPAPHAPPPLHHVHPTPAPRAPITVIEPKEQPNTIKPSAAVAAAFVEFWKIWPKRVGKAQAEKAWYKIKPGAELQAEIRSAVMRQLASAGWQRDGGQFIPHPATWLNGRRWEDETVDAVPPAVNGHDYRPWDGAL